MGNSMFTPQIWMGTYMNMPKIARKILVFSSLVIFMALSFGLTIGASTSEIIAEEAIEHVD